MKKIIVWFRQDLRLYDNPALFNAILEGACVIPLYILDKRSHRIVHGAQTWWLHQSLEALQKQLLKQHCQLLLKQGDTKAILHHLINEYKIDAVFWNRCYEPLAIVEDSKIKQFLQELGIEVKSFNSALLTEPWEIKNHHDSYYKVFTHYWKNVCKEKIIRNPLPVSRIQHTVKLNGESLGDFNLLPKPLDWSLPFQSYWKAGEKEALHKLNKFVETHLKNYANKRNYLSTQTTSHLSAHLHFGEISPVSIWHVIKQKEGEEPGFCTGAQCYLSELGWREFAYYLMYYFRDLDHKNYRDKFNQFPWENNEIFLQAWQKGKTGYPIVDAAMRELWHTGYMHNRARMIVASFLTKHLLIDWQKGAAWFLDTLVDADLAVNSMNWQWAFGSGVDAAPFFRIFNPVLQGEKFDKNGSYVRRWLPELSRLPDKLIHKPWTANRTELETAKVTLGNNYPFPLVDHAFARQRALMLFKNL